MDTKKKWKRSKGGKEEGEKEREERRGYGGREGKGKGGRQREEVLFCVWFSQVVIS